MEGEKEEEREESSEGMRGEREREVKGTLIQIHFSPTTLVAQGNTNTNTQKQKIPLTVHNITLYNSHINEVYTLYSVHPLIQR